PVSGARHMNPSSWSDAGDGSLQVLAGGGERVFIRRWLNGTGGDGNCVLAVLPAAEHPTPGSLNRLTHEYGLKDDLDRAWAVRPLELVRERGRTMLLVEDSGGEPLDCILGEPMELGGFLHLVIGIATALRKVDHDGLVHKRLATDNIHVICAVTGVSGAAC